MTLRRLATIAPLFALGACATYDQPPKGPLAATELRDGAGAAVGGAAVLDGANGAMVLRLALSGIAPGPHGLHLHTTGKCEGPGFASAGGHLNPGARQHGHDNPAGAHLGDLPNVTPAADGSVNIVIPLNGTREELAQALMDEDGTALVVHAGPDDYKTDPSGNSGSRIACGVLIRPYPSPAGSAR